MIKAESDAELLRRGRADPDAFATFYRRHALAVYRSVLARVHDPIVATELTAETFAEAWLSARRFRDPGTGAAGPWLRGIAENLIRRLAHRTAVEDRARRRIGLRADSEPGLPFDEAEERMLADSLRPLLAEALGHLPEGQRRAVELRVVDQLPYKDVAQCLGCAPNVARMQVSRALRSLSIDLAEVLPP